MGSLRVAGEEDGGEAGRLELRAALALSEVPDFGPARFRLVVDSWGSSAAAARACARGEALDRVPRESIPWQLSFSKELLSGLRRVRPMSEDRLRRLEKRGIRVVRYRGPGYPERLTHLHAPPPVLYLQGPVRLPDRRAVAIVGSRRATEYGRRMARDLGAGLASLGWTVVSGMARGIDGTGHRGALDAGGATVGVLGSGLDHEYPGTNRDLYGAMRERGLLASEFPPPEPPQPGHFPRRNRIIAALADAVVVVQAARKSGAMTTVDHAQDLGREVFAVPGPVGPGVSEGVHHLLRQGAGLVTRAEDVLEGLELRPTGVSPERSGEATEAGDALGGPDVPAGHRVPGERRILAELERGSAAADDLAVASGLGPGEALALLSRLELRGLIRSLPGGRYRRCGG